MINKKLVLLLAPTSLTIVLFFINFEMAFFILPAIAFCWSIVFVVADMVKNGFRFFKALRMLFYLTAFHIFVVVVASFFLYGFYDPIKDSLDDAGMSLWIIFVLVPICILGGAMYLPNYLAKDRVGNVQDMTSGSAQTGESGQSWSKEMSQVEKALRKSDAKKATLLLLVLAIVSIFIF